jgi:tetratricopeptide (TPR) repeat protein
MADSINTLIEQLDDFLAQKDLKQASQWLTKLEHHPDYKTNPLYQCEYLLDEAIILELSNEHTEALIHYQKAQDYAVRHGLARQQVLIYMGIGRICRNEGKQNSAIYFFEQAQDVALKNDLKMDVAGLKTNLAIMHTSQGDFLTAYKLFFEAKLVFEELGKTRHVLLGLSNIVGLYREMHHYEKAEKAIHEFMQLYDQEPNDAYLCDVLISKGYIHFHRCQFKDAMVVFSDAYQLAKDLSISEFMIDAQLGKVQVYLEQQESHKASMLLDQVDQEVQLTKLPRSRSFYSLLRIAVAFKRGDSYLMKDGIKRSKWIIEHYGFNHHRTILHHYWAEYFLMEENLEQAQAQIELAIAYSNEYIDRYYLAKNLFLAACIQIKCGDLSEIHLDKAMHAAQDIQNHKIQQDYLIRMASLMETFNTDQANEWREMAEQIYW